MPMPEVMVCRKAEDQEPVPGFCLNDREVESVESFKYLGVMFHCSKGLAGSFDHRLALAVGHFSLLPRNVRQPVSITLPQCAVCLRCVSCLSCFMQLR